MILKKEKLMIDEISHSIWVVFIDPGYNVEAHFEYP